AALQPFPERLFHRVSRLRRSCVMSLTLRTDLQVELLTAFLNTRGPRAILSSDSYPLDHSPVVIELLFGTLSVLVTSLSLRSTISVIINIFEGLFPKFVKAQHNRISDLLKHAWVNLSHSPSYSSYINYDHIEHHTSSLKITQWNFTTSNISTLVHTCTKGYMTCL
ncbi:hypothetical protein HETIRDRAFT_315670, partial [Heterobasidion irregulare TC 32-1]